ncbi:MAG: response regulator transcription factor [Chryseobacterium sp.]|nr:MAG: response regulator transcription factor [Chryseobacterium sp.]
MSSTEHKTINFLLADDHSLIRQGIVFVLEDMEIDCHIYHASNLQQVMHSITANDIDIAIIDAHFPDGNSLSIIAEIKKISPQTKILIFSGIDETIQALKFLNEGANGFLSKLSEEDELKQAISKIINEGEYISAVTQVLLMNSLRNRHLINPLLSLTERELQIAEMYTEGLGNLEIANKLDIKQNTVSTLKKRIFDKLKVENIIELVDLMKAHY